VNVGLVVAFGVSLSWTVAMMRRVVGLVSEGMIDWALGMGDPYSCAAVKLYWLMRRNCRNLLITINFPWKNNQIKVCQHSFFTYFCTPKNKTLVMFEGLGFRSSVGRAIHF
jgi:hypothetical protein